jgi:plasmid stabilization system protein ParE
MNLRFTKTAKKRLNEIYDFIAKNSPIAANALYNEFLDEIDLLLDFPYIASIEPVLNHPETFRSLVIRKTYKVIYYLTSDTIVIATIWDCRRNPDKLEREISRIKR